MDSTPEYAEGEIVVCPYPSINEDFVANLAEWLGYKMKDEVPEHSGLYPIVTGVGYEQEAIDQFSRYGEFFDWIDFRELEGDRRKDNLETAIGMMRDLRDQAGELPNDQYNKGIEEICNYLSGLEK